MAVVFSVLKVIGIVFLCVLAFLLLLLLLILFVPFRYHLIEKGGRSETYGIEKTDPSAEFTVSWLLHFLRGDASIVYHDKMLSAVASGKIMGIRFFSLNKKLQIPPQINGSDGEQEKSIQETAEEQEPEQEEKAVSPVKKLLCALKEEKTGIKKEKIKKHLGGILKNILPRKGKQRFWFGTGDPFDTAWALGAAAFFYPLYKNRIEIIPDMAAQSLYSEGDISGKLFVGSVLYHAAVLYFDKDIKKLLQQLKGENDG